MWINNKQYTLDFLWNLADGLVEFSCAYSRFPLRSAFSFIMRSSSAGATYERLYKCNMPTELLRPGTKDLIL